MADFPVIINLPFKNFSEQASTSGAFKPSTKVVPPLHLFSHFATSSLLGYISETMTPICVRIKP